MKTGRNKIPTITALLVMIMGLLLGVQPVRAETRKKGKARLPFTYELNHTPGANLLVPDVGYNGYVYFRGLLRTSALFYIVWKDEYYDNSPIVRAVPSGAIISDGHYSSHGEMWSNQFWTTRVGSDAPIAGDSRKWMKYDVWIYASDQKTLLEEWHFYAEGQ